MLRLNFISSIFGYKFWIGGFILVIALGVTLCFQQVKKAEARVTAEVTNRITLEYNRKLLRMQDQYIVMQNQLTAKHQEIQNETQANLDATTAKYNAMVGSLSNRASRYTTSNTASPTTTSNTEVRPAVTGAELSINDGKFLVEFSYYTELLKVSLISCYKQYDNAKDKLNEYQQNLK
jgi:hypothetical protein